MIMAGGGGTRFWPRSRAKRPKQFLTFGGDRTLLQGTLDRIEAQVPPDRCWVITPAAHRQGVDAFRVRGFREKPSREVAQKYLASGEYDWNSGIFVWKARTILAELERLKPGIHAAVRHIAEAWDTPGRDAVFREQY